MAAEFDFQAAIYSKLSGAAAITALTSTVVDFGTDDEDQSLAYPYVSIGDAIFAEWDTDNTTGFDVLLRVHSYSDSSSAKECKQMQAAIYATLHRQGLTVSGYETLFMDRESSSILRTSLGAFHGVCEYRALLSKI